MRRRAFVVGTLCAAGTTGCGKTRLAPPPPLVWREDVDLAFAEGRRTGRPVFIMFGATWDCASKELEHVTFAHPDVMAVFHDGFVIARVDCSDDENPTTQRLATRFDIKGTPTMIAVHARSEHELFRMNEFVPPEKLVPHLRAARQRNDAMRDIDASLHLGAAWHRPVMFFVGPSYDTASAAIRRECFRDSEVQAFLRDCYVFSDVWSDDGANADWERLDVKGSPSTIIYDGERRVEIARSTGLVEARAYAAFLRGALARYAG